MRLKQGGRQHRAISDQRLLVVLITLSWLLVGVEIVDDPYEQRDDTHFDATLRPTDPNGDATVGSNTTLPDLLTVRIGGWQPTDPAADLFLGEFVDPNALFVRIELELAGLINPPGPAEQFNHDPYRYGPSPIYGFVEIDVDDDSETGGETDAPHYRFLSNVARFGGLPNKLVYRNRCAREGADVDDNFTTSPQIERHGEEFHIAFLGDAFSVGDISFCVGDADAFFEADETWQITGSWFHRAHGFEDFSLADGGSKSGEYAPTATLEFAHTSATNTTTISLVFPLTNAGSAAARQEITQPYNADPSDQASIAEGLDDLVISALVTSGHRQPDYILIEDWGDKYLAEYLDPREWTMTCLFGTLDSFYETDGPYFIWTDVFPDVLRGDLNGNQVINIGDRNNLEAFIDDRDIDDGVLDNRVALDAHAVNFSVYDLFPDGIVDVFDLGVYAPKGDTNFDQTVDMHDFIIIQDCFTGSGKMFTIAPCVFADINRDEDIDIQDLLFILTAIDQ